VVGLENDRGAVVWELREVVNGYRRARARGVALGVYGFDAQGAKTRRPPGCCTNCPQTGTPDDRSFFFVSDSVQLGGAFGVLIRERAHVRDDLIPDGALCCASVHTHVVPHRDVGHATNELFELLVRPALTDIAQTHRDIEEQTVQAGADGGVHAGFISKNIAQSVQKYCEGDHFLSEVLADRMLDNELIRCALLWVLHQDRPQANDDVFDQPAAINC